MKNLEILRSSSLAQFPKAILPILLLALTACEQSSDKAPAVFNCNVKHACITGGSVQDGVTNINYGQPDQSPDASQENKTNESNNKCDDLTIKVQELINKEQQAVLHKKCNEIYKTKNTKVGGYESKCIEMVKPVNPSKNSGDIKNQIYNVCAELF